MDDDFGLNFDQKKRHNEPRFETFSSVRSHRSDRGREEDAKHDDSVDRRGPSRVLGGVKRARRRRKLIFEESNFFRFFHDGERRTAVVVAILHG